MLRIAQRKGNSFSTVTFILVALKNLHPSYSPDLDPPDFYLQRFWFNNSWAIKKLLRKINLAVPSVFNFFGFGIKKFTKPWKLYVHLL